MHSSLITRATASMEMQGEEGVARWWLAYGLLLLLPWVLIWSRSASDAIFCIISLLFLWRSVSTRDWQWTRLPAIRFAAAIWLWMLLVSSPFAVVSSAVSFAVAVPWIRYVLLYAAVRYWLLKKLPAQKLLARMGLIFFFFIILDTLTQYKTGVSLSGNFIDVSGRLTGPMDNVKVGIFLAKLLFPWMGMALFLKPRANPRFYYAVVLTLLFFSWLTILLSGERTALLVASLAIVCSLIFVARIEKKMRLLCVWMLAMLLLGGVLMIETQSWVQFRSHMLVEQLGNFKNSSYGQLFSAGYELGKHYWLQGTGLKGFRELCAGLHAPGVNSYCDLHPHNPYIEFFAETGLIGLALFIGLVSSLFYEAAAKMFTMPGFTRVLPTAALATWVVNFFPFMPTQSFYSNWPGMLAWLSLAVGFSALNLYPPAVCQDAAPLPNNGRLRA
jgi:O-antigen ligase